jgi:transcriptional repressor NF-X1
MIDQEPQRSVQLLRRIDTRIPTPLLSVTCGAAAPVASSSGLGRLATNMRGGGPMKMTSASPMPSSSAGRGWTSVVTRPITAAPISAPMPVTASPRPAVTPVLVPHALRPDSRGPALEATAADVPDDWEDDV